LARNYTEGQDALPDEKTEIELELAWNRGCKWDKEATCSKN